MTIPTRDGGFPGCFSLLTGLLAPGILGVSAAGSPTDVPTLVRVAIFLVVTAAVGALVYGIWSFLRATPVPERTDVP